MSLFTPRSWLIVTALLLGGATTALRSRGKARWRPRCLGLGTGSAGAAWTMSQTTAGLRSPI